MLTEVDYLSPPEIARLLRVDHNKILLWIHRGELRAADVSLNRKRPRYKVAKTDLAAFLARRSTSPEPKPKRRRKRQDSQVIEFYK